MGHLQLKGEDMKIVRNLNLLNKVVMVDGHPGCGKTMLSPIISSLERVEKLSYCYELEHYCALNYLKKLDDNSTKAMINLTLDQLIYDQTFGRDVNFNVSDLSSALNNINPNKYIRRILDNKEPKEVPKIIKDTQPILHLTTHCLLPTSNILLNCLKDKLVFIELIRHPAFMIRQQYLNMERMYGITRDFGINFDYKGIECPFFLKGYEDKYIKSNNIERAILSIEAITNVHKSIKNNIITIPFESFVIKPDEYLKEILEKLNTKITSYTYDELKRQNIPRENHEDGVDLPVYRNLGWIPNKEKEKEISFVKEKASQKMFNKFENMCEEYERKYL
jgi:hypothetical protein